LKEVLNLDIVVKPVVPEMPSVEELYLDECRFTDRFIKNFASSFTSVKVIKILQGLHSCCTLVLEALKIPTLTELTAWKLTWKKKRNDRQFVFADDDDTARLREILIIAGVDDIAVNPGNISFRLHKNTGQTQCSDSPKGQAEDEDAPAPWLGELLKDDNYKELEKDYYREWWSMFYTDYDSYKRLNK